ncbi:MAG: CBS domain-containing protein [Deltaproteobacteria bacterium]|nr:CBS domain-containing protein [Deltaproteobacteria bacterium]
MKRSTTKGEQVRDRMSRSVISVTSDDTLETAIDLLARKKVRELPVVEKGRLIGIVTDRDLREVAPSYPLFRDTEEIRQHLKRLKVANAMTIDPLVINPEAPLGEAAEMLLRYQIGSLPVVENHKVVGILSVSDILKAYIEQNRGCSDEA